MPTDAVTPPESPRGSTPDPTLMTIDSIRREIQMLSDLFESRLAAAEELESERFARIDALMDRAEEMRREQKSDTRLAVQAALDSQKEATTKMESSTEDQLASLRDNFDTAIKSVQSSIADLKDRVTTLESLRQGMSQQRTERRQATAGTLAAVGLGIAVLAAALTLVGFVIGSG